MCKSTSIVESRVSSERQGGSGSGYRQLVVGKSRSATTSWVEGGGTHHRLRNCLKGRSRVLIFCRTTVAWDGVFFLDPIPTISNTNVGTTTRTCYNRNGRKGCSRTTGQPERRPINKKNTYAAKTISGVVGGRAEMTTYGNVCQKRENNTETCWTADEQYRHGHAPLGEKGVGGN